MSIRDFRRKFLKMRETPAESGRVDMYEYFRNAKIKSSSIFLEYGFKVQEMDNRKNQVS